MDWFRHYHGLCTDPKLHRVARSAGVSRGLVIAAWCAILEAASQGEPRGYVRDLDGVSLGFLIDTKPHIASKILEAIQTANMLDDDGKLVAWDRRQRASDDAAERKRNQRRRDHEIKPLEMQETYTQCHATKPSRTEQKETPTSNVEIQITAPPTGGPAEPVAPPEKAKAVLWREMKTQIGGKDPGALVRKWLKAHGEAEVFAAHFAAMAHSPEDYVTWVAGRLRANGKTYSSRASPMRGGRSYAEMKHDELFGDDDATDESELEALSGCTRPLALLC